VRRMLRSAPKVALLGVAACAGAVGVFAVAHAAIDPSTPDPAPSASAAPSGLHVQGEVVEAANNKGWHKTAATIHWTCTDDSGTVTHCPADDIVTREGVDDVVSSEAATDDAGHVEHGVVQGLKIDSHEPETTPSYSAPVYTDPATGTQWYGESGPHVSVVSDNDDIVPGVVSSGVADIYVEADDDVSHRQSIDDVNGGDIKGAHVASGTHTLRTYSDDNAGNVETKSGNPRRRPITVHIDGDDPHVTATRSAQPNAFGWYNAPVSITYACTDDTTGVADCPAPVTYGTEGLDDQVTAVAHDKVANPGSDTEHMNIDRSGPSVNAGPSEAPNANGWYNHAVTVHTVCDDSLSGVNTCSPDQIIDGDGPHSGSGKGSDRAGNSTLSNFNLKIDKTAPTLTINGVTDGQQFPIGSTVNPTCSASDATSGLAAPCSGTLSRAISGVGTYTYTATVRDLAGNTTTKKITFSIVYGFNLQQPGANSQQSAGNTIQVVFAATNNQGKGVQTAATPIFAAPLRGGAIKQSSTASPFVAAGQPSGTFTFDPKKATYTFAWQTTKDMAGFWWQLQIKLDDGTTHTVIVGLK